MDSPRKEVDSVDEKNTSRAERIDDWGKLITYCENRPDGMAWTSGAG